MQSVIPGPEPFFERSVNIALAFKDVGKGESHIPPRKHVQKIQQIPFVPAVILVASGAGHEAGRIDVNEIA